MAKEPAQATSYYLREALVDPTGLIKEEITLMKRLPNPLPTLPLPPVELVLPQQPSHIVTGFKFTGNALFKSDDLQKVLVSNTRNLLNRQSIAKDITALQKLYSDKGLAVIVRCVDQDEAGRVSFILLEAKLTQIKVSGYKGSSLGKWRR